MEEKVVTKLNMRFLVVDIIRSTSV